MRALLFLKNECRQSFKILCSLACILALALSIATAIGQTERMIKSSSAKAAEQFDILVGAKGSRTSLLLSTVYLRDEMISLTPASALNVLRTYDGVKWFAPLAFGDRVGDSPLVGTTRAFVTLGGERALHEGREFTARDEAVVGIHSGLQLGETVYPHHGRISGVGHKHDNGFKVVGILPQTGTPWDRSVLVPIESIWAMHEKGKHEEPKAIESWLGADDFSHLAGFSAIAVKPVSISDAYKIRQGLSSVSVDDAKGQAVNLMAIFTGEVLVELYATLDSAMTAFEWFAASSVLISLLAVLITGFILGELRKPQFLQLRTMGAPRGYVMQVVWLLIMSVVLSGVVMGLAGGWGLAQIAAVFISQDTGIAMTPVIGLQELQVGLVTLVLGAIFAVLPAVKVGRSPLR